MQEKNYTRPDNLLEALGINFQPLSEDERAMKSLLLEEYRKSDKNVLEEVRRWRDQHPGASLADSIRGLYQEIGGEI